MGRRDRDALGGLLQLLHEEVLGIAGAVVFERGALRQVHALQEAEQDPQEHGQEVSVG